MTVREWLWVVPLGIAIGWLGVVLADPARVRPPRTEVRVIREDSPPPPPPSSIVVVDQLSVFPVAGPGPQRLRIARPLRAEDVEEAER